MHTCKYNTSAQPFICFSFKNRTFHAHTYKEHFISSFLRLSSICVIERGGQGNTHTLTQRRHLQHECDEYKLLIAKKMDSKQKGMLSSSPPCYPRFILISSPMFLLMFTHNATHKFLDTQTRPRGLQALCLLKGFVLFIPSFCKAV